MSDDNTQDGAEPSLASAGSQPVAWEIRRSDGALEAFTPCVRMAEQILRCIGVGAILPLYRHPQPALTDEERGAMHRLCRAVARHSALQRIRGLKDRFADEDEQAYSIVRGWLARLT